MFEKDWAQFEPKDAYSSQAAGGSSSSKPNPLVQLDPGLFIWTIITFLLVLFLLSKFAGWNDRRNDLKLEEVKTFPLFRDALPHPIHDDKESFLDLKISNRKMTFQKMGTPTQPFIKLFNFPTIFLNQTCGWLVCGINQLNVGCYKYKQCSDVPYAGHARLI